MRSSLELRAVGRDGIVTQKKRKNYQCGIQQERNSRLSQPSDISDETLLLFFFILSYRVVCDGTLLKNVKVYSFVQATHLSPKQVWVCLLSFNSQTLLGGQSNRELYNTI